MLDDLDLLKKKSESRHHKPKSHQRETGTDPCEKSPFGRQKIA